MPFSDNLTKSGKSYNITERGFFFFTRTTVEYKFESKN